jgi:hypothetical protein
MKEVVVKISGRIAKYFFGSLREDYYLEMQEALQYCSDDVETVSDLTNLIFSLSLDNWGMSPIENLYNGISRENLEKFSKLTELVDWILDEEPGHYALIDDMFDYAGQNSERTHVTFFEDDAYITVTVDDEEILSEQNLEEFTSITSSGNIEDNEGSQEHNNIKTMLEKHEDFEFSEVYGWDSNEHGSIFITDWFSPNDLNTFNESTDSDKQVTILFDDITEWEFFTETEEFDFKDLTFLGFSNASDFRDSSCNQIFNYLFYKGELMGKQENWIRDKGITLTIGESRRYDTLDFLING